MHPCDCQYVCDTIYVHPCSHSGGGLLDPVLGHQTRGPGCLCQLKAPHHAQGRVQQAALPDPARSGVCGTWSEEGLSRHQR